MNFNGGNDYEICGFDSTSADIAGDCLDFKLITDSTLGAEVMGQGQYDLVILDNDMPRLSGPDALARADRLLDDAIKSNRTSPKVIPVIGYSGMHRARWNLPNLSHFQLIRTFHKGMPPSKLKHELEEGILASLKTLTA